jgi:4-amino-4-deoxy-L-arabinose transferase-like glycosyltransferase
VKRLATLSALLALLGLAGWLRAVPFELDLPYAPSIDEPWFVEPALAAAGDGEWNPHWFGHPGSTMIYPLALLYRLDARSLRASPSVKAHYIADPARAYRLARGLALVYAMAALVLVFLAARRLFDAPVGLFALALLATQPNIVLYCKIARSDAAAFFFAALTMLLLARLWESPSLRAYVWLGVGLGLAIATKYYLVMLALVAPAAVLRDWRNGLRAAGALGRLGAAAAATAVSFLAITPYFLPRFFREVLPSVRDETMPLPSIVYQPSAWRAMAWFLGSNLRQSLGTVTLLLFLAGLAALVGKRRWAPLVLGCSVLAFCVGAGFLGHLQPRWFLPFLFVCFPIAGHGAKVCVGALGKWLPEGARAGLVVVIGLGLAIPHLRETLDDQRELSRPTTASESRRWAFDHLPAGAALVAEADNGNWMSWAGDPNAYAVGRTLRVARVQIAYEFSFDEMRCHGYTHLLININKYRRAIMSGHFGAALFLAQLLHDGRLLKTFAPSEHSSSARLQLWDLTSVACTAR